MKVDRIVTLGNRTMGRVLRSWIATILLSAVAFATAALPAQAVPLTYTFKDGSPTPFFGGTYTGTADASVSNNSNANMNIGGSPNIWVGDYTGGLIRRTLIRFDLSALTAADYDQVQSITLNLFPSSLADTGNGGNTLQVFQIAAANGAWIEGATNFAAAAAGEPTWNNRAHPSTTWAGSTGLGTAGADYVNTVLSSAPWTTGTPLNTPLGGGLTFTGSAAQLTSLVDTWLGAGGNAGLLLSAPVLSAGQRLLILHSADSTSASFRPELVITFTPTVPPVPEPGTLGLSLLGAALLFQRFGQSRFRRRNK